MRPPRFRESGRENSGSHMSVMNEMARRLSSALVAHVASWLDLSELVQWDQTCKAWRCVSMDWDARLWRAAYERAGFIARHCSGVRDLAQRTWRQGCLVQLGLSRAWAGATELRITVLAPLAWSASDTPLRWRHTDARIYGVLLALAGDLVMIADLWGRLCCWSASRHDDTGKPACVAAWHTRHSGQDCVQCLAACPLEGAPETALVAIGLAGVVEIWRVDDNDSPWLVRVIEPNGFLRLSLDPPVLALTADWLLTMAMGTVCVWSVASGERLATSESLTSERRGQFAAVDAGCSRLWTIDRRGPQMEDDWVLAELPTLAVLDARVGAC